MLVLGQGSSLFLLLSSCYKSVGARHVKFTQQAAGEGKALKQQLHAVIFAVASDDARLADDQNAVCFTGVGIIGVWRT